MFTGIVTEQGIVSSIKSNNGYSSISIKCSKKFIKGLKKGASVAVNGVCLTSKKDSGGANGHSSNQVRGLITGGYDGSGIINNIDFITIATTGNAQDFGECSQPSGWGYIANTTDSHGGLGGF